MRLPVDLWPLDPLPLGAWAFAPWSAGWWRVVTRAKLAELRQKSPLDT